MSYNKELQEKLIDDDELDNIEWQKEEIRPFIVAGIAVKSPSSSKKRKKAARRGCPCWCKCIGITMLIFTLIGMLALACVYSYFKEVVEQLTVETPQKFPIVYMSEPELYEVEDRVSSFFDEILDEKSSIKDLVLEQDEINGFIGHSDYLRGNLMITFHENKIVEEYSLPMDVVGLPGRYFVGNEYTAIDENSKMVEMKMETEATHEDWFDGPLFFLQLQYLFTKNKEDEGKTMLEVYLEKGSFFGQMIPQEEIDEHINLVVPFMEGFNSAMEDADDEDVEHVMDVVHGIEGIESIIIKEGKVVVKAKQHSNN